jgi:hypothetical protein
MKVIKNGVFCVTAGFFRTFLFYSEDGGGMFLRNFGGLLLNDMELQLKCCTHRNWEHLGFL